MSTSQVPHELLTFPDHQQGDGRKCLPGGKLYRIFCLMCQRCFKMFKYFFEFIRCFKQLQYFCFSQPHRIAP